MQPEVVTFFSFNRTTNQQCRGVATRCTMHMYECVRPDNGRSCINGAGCTTNALIIHPTAKNCGLLTRQRCR